MGYFESLVQWGVFTEVEVSFLPTGHTHSNIDKAFCTTARLLCAHDAITFHDLHHELSQCFNEMTIMTGMDNCVNWSGPCETTSGLPKVKGIALQRLFRSSRSADIHGSPTNVVCSVTSTADDDYGLMSLLPIKNTAIS